MNEADQSKFRVSAEDRTWPLRALLSDPALRLVLDQHDAGRPGRRPAALVERPGDVVIYRGWRHGNDGERHAVLFVLPTAEHPSAPTLNRLNHEYALRDELDGAWALKPIELVRDGTRVMLVLGDCGGEPLQRLLGAPMEVGRFLRLAIGVAVTLGRLHQRGLVHKDVKPTNILVNAVTGDAWLTGFGIATRLPRERQAPE